MNLKLSNVFFPKLLCAGAQLSLSLNAPESYNLVFNKSSRLFFFLSVCVGGQQGGVFEDQSLHI